jgi:hypothetical protein
MVGRWITARSSRCDAVGGGDGSVVVNQRPAPDELLMPDDAIRIEYGTPGEAEKALQAARSEEG